MSAVTVSWDSDLGTFEKQQNNHTIISWINHT